MSDRMLASTPSPSRRSVAAITITSFGCLENNIDLNIPDTSNETAIYAHIHPSWPTTGYRFSAVRTGRVWDLNTSDDVVPPHPEIPPTGPAWPEPGGSLRGDTKNTSLL